MIEFDVVIPTKNRPEDLKRMIASIEIQTQKPKRVVIVDQSLVIKEIFCSFHYEVIHLHAHFVSGLTAAKNLGVSKCTSEVIHFFDDDIILDLDYFEKINNHLEVNPNIYGICGRQKNSKSSRFKLFMFSLFHRGRFTDVRKKCNSGFVNIPLVFTNILPGGITAYRKKVFEKYQFDEALIKYCLGEDMDFSYRVSQEYNLAFATDALALHNHSPIGRYDPKESFACKIAGYSYFYDKNLTKNTYNLLSYLWVLVGVYCDAFSYALCNLNLSSIKGLIKGHIYIRNKYKKVPFIDVNKIIF